MAFIRATSDRWPCGGCGSIYIVLILLVIGAMFLHNAIIWRAKALAKRKMQNPFMTRMTTKQRWQHLILLTSFIVLVITGFALKFPNSWLAEVLGMGETAAQHHPSRGGRGADCGGDLSHLLSAAAREGRRLIWDLAPRPKDISTLWARCSTTSD